MTQTSGLPSGHSCVSHPSVLSELLTAIVPVKKTIEMQFESGSHKQVPTFFEFH